MVYKETQIAIETEVDTGIVTISYDEKPSIQALGCTDRVGSDGLSHRLPSHTTVRAGRHTAVGPPFLNRFPIVHKEEHALFLQP